LFCPIHDLGIIIVDEEHEPSFKQDEKLKYNARDSAIVLAQLQNCPIVLGSATPSLESWKNTLDGRYELHQPHYAPRNSALPPVEIVALEGTEERILGTPRLAEPKSSRKNDFSSRAKKSNRFIFESPRALAPVVFCTACGHTRQCPNCDINLTLHFHQHLICHYCDYHENRPDKCPDCREGLMEPMGLGTERIEADLKRIFPEARIRRADRDEIQGREALEELIKDMEEEKIDILIGTQMIAKGLDFPKLKLVGLVLADIGFNIPDFRANERSFQLMTQMSGRSGRHQVEGEAPGEVLVQAFNTSHESLLFAQHHDFEGFAVQELEHRQAASLSAIFQNCLFANSIPKTSPGTPDFIAFGRKSPSFEKLKFEPYLGLEILGPAEAPLAKLRNQFRFHVLLKSDKPQILNRFVRQLLGDEDWVPSSVRILVDIDPLHLL
jgi:primosomal protein N' (replication factor Y)